VTRILVDTNVILDVVLARKPWAGDATSLLDAVAKGRARGYVAGHAVTTVHYVVEKERGRAVAATAVSDLLQLLTVVPLHGEDFQRALGLALEDYEDGVQVAACFQVEADYLVTRNSKDFVGAPVASRTPGEILALLSTSAADSSQ
jgi:predicted nucleic acid-binding protein